MKSLCKQRKIPISRLERDLGFANGYISQLRKGVFPSDRLAKIADYFSVSIDYLLGGGTVTFFDNLKEACFKKGTSPTALLKSLGMSTSSVTSWKKGVTPSINTVYRLAESLGVDPAVLIDSAARPTFGPCNSGNIAIFYDVYAELCNNAGKKPSVVAAELGINKSNVSNWKNNGYTPRGDALQKIAKYFNVSTDYLLTGEQKEKAPIPTNYPDEEEPKSSSSNQAEPETVFYDEYIRLCNSISKSPTAVAKEMGFAGAHVTKWKKGSIPTDATIFKICDYFNLPHDYFSAEGDEETKIAVIQSDNEPIYLENTYLRLAQGAKELGLNDNDVSAILDFFRKLKL